MSLNLHICNKISRNPVSNSPFPFLFRGWTQEEEELGSISAAFLGPVTEGPPWQERLDAWAANHVCDVT